jgi:hypothetical protein
MLNTNEELWVKQQVMAGQRTPPPLVGYSGTYLMTVQQIMGAQSIEGGLPIILLPKSLVGKTVKVTIEET